MFKAPPQMKFFTLKKPKLRDQVQCNAPNTTQPPKYFYGYAPGSGSKLPEKLNV